MVEISTSILSVNENEMKTFYNLEVAKTDYFHIDVMDGKFVKQNTINKMKENTLSLKHITNLPLDVHLMVSDIEKYVDEFIQYDPHIITFHIEAMKEKNEILKIIEKIKNNNIKVGIALSPNTKIEEVLEFLPYIHLVLIMTVEPGEGGQKLITSTIDKIRKIQEYIQENNIDVDIEADGGIDDTNVEQIKNAGASIIVAGTYIISSNNYENSIKKLKF